MLLLRNLYPGLLHNLGHLDLHDLSPGAAVAALRWWLTDARPGRHELVVGQGNSRKPWRDADLKSAFEQIGWWESFWGGGGVKIKRSKRDQKGVWFPKESLAPARATFFMFLFLRFDACLTRKEAILLV